MAKCKLPGGSGILEVENVNTPGFWWRITFKDSYGVELAAATPCSSGASIVTAHVTLPLAKPLARGHCELSQLCYVNQLRDCQDITHMSQHWYVFFMLASKRFLPAAWVDADMMPEKSSTVAILHGVALKGMSLSLKTTEAFLTKHLVFCTVYSRGSMPIIAGFSLRRPEEILPASPEDGFWQVRVVRRDASIVMQDLSAEIRTALVWLPADETGKDQ